MIAIRYTLKLLEPLLATALQSDPNSAVSYPFIPGSLIRGALIGKYLTHSKAKYFAAAKETRQRFLDDKTCYLNCYLLDDTGNRTLPTPLSWYKDKSAKLDDGYAIFDKAHPDFDKADFLANDEIKQPKTHEEKFCTVDDETVTLYKPARQINIHTRREDRSAGRATDDNLGAVFRYDALAAGQSFSGVILCDVDDDAKALFKDLNDTELIIGGSRSGGYGQVRVSKIEKISNWREIDNAPNNISAGETFILTLLSDVIVRDENGQFTDTLSVKAVAQALGIAESALTAEKKIYRQTAMVGGFNRKWGLPLPQNLTIRAGSVFTFKATADISTKAIETLLWDGIGERRAEGFGRVAINWIDSEKLTAQKPTGKNTSLEKPKLDAESQKLAQQMNERLFRRNADRALVEKSNRIAITINNSPKRSQLGSLRVKIRRALQAGSTRLVIEYLDNMKDKVAGKQFQNARLGPKPLKDWLDTLLQNPDNIWQQLGTPEKNPLHLEEVTLSSALATEYTLRFVDAVLAVASKKERDND